MHLDYVYLSVDKWVEECTLYVLKMILKRANRVVLSR